MVAEYEIYLVLFTAFAVPSIMAFISYVKRGSTTETKEAIADMVIKGILKDIESIEQRLRLMDMLDRDLVSIKLRLSNIEDTLRNNRISGSDKK